MPNCDFYSTIEDHELILNHIFERNDCEIYELASDFEKPLKQFYSASEVLAEFNRTYQNGNKWTSVYLKIYVLGSGFKFKPTKVSLNAEKCGGFEYRYSAKHLGLIQLYLESSTDSGLKNSHTNHINKKRAEKCARTPEEAEEVALCDFNKITKYSSMLNRFIRKKSVAKVSSRSILSGAYELWEKGIALHPYSPSDTKIEIK